MQECFKPWKLRLFINGVVAAMILSSASVTETASAATRFTVSPSGSDTNPGSEKKPFATLRQAQDAVRAHRKRGKTPITVVIREGTYYLDKALVLTDADSGSASAPVTYKGEGKVVISGGVKLTLAWEAHKDGILMAKTPQGLSFDQLFVNGQRRHMARYPNFDANASPYNGAAGDAFAPSRAATWANPAGGYIHAMHKAHWGGYHYRITGKKENNEVTYEGGWQNNRQMGMHAKHRFVENIFEELDAPGEWFHDEATQTLYYLPDTDVDVKTALFEVVRLRHLVELQGTQEKPVTHVTLEGLTFRHTARTFMDTKEPLLRSDWTIYRGGTVLINGAEDCAIADCEFDQVGGNAVFVNMYNRRITVRGCHIHGSGASGVCFVGDPDAVRNPLFEYNQTLAFNEIDRTPGPKSENYPADCLVEDSLIHNVSVVEKQATGVQISMSQGITVRHCSVYDVGRAGINISEGTFGGHVIEFCDVFDTVRETGDHGSFNSWGRDRFWHLRDAPGELLPELALLDAGKTIIRNSRWRCDHGWDVDLDDGSSNYEIYNNLFLNGGLKLREGFHRKVYNNIAINNTLHAHVWYPNSMDVVTRNIWMGAYKPVWMNTEHPWGKEIDYNVHLTEASRLKFAEHGCDANSVSGDPLFVDPASGDFRVQDDSPALTIGFKNFPMDQFGVQKAALKAVARTPIIPELKGIKSSAKQDDAASIWQGATVLALTGEAYSAFGISKDDGGVHLIKVPDGTPAAGFGLKTGDLIQSFNGKAIQTLEDLMNAAVGKQLDITIVRGQNHQDIHVKR